MTLCVLILVDWDLITLLCHYLSLLWWIATLSRHYAIICSYCGGLRPYHLIMMYLKYVIHMMDVIKVSKFNNYYQEFLLYI